MPTVESFRGYTATIVAALLILGGVAALIYLATLPPVDPPRDLTPISTVIGGLIATGSTFLFLQESSSRASHAAERAIDQGVIAGAALPQQAPGTTTTTVTSAPPEAPPADLVGPEVVDHTGDLTEFHG